MDFLEVKYKKTKIFTGNHEKITEIWFQGPCIKYVGWGPGEFF